ncbi:MAG: type II secretion system minor pseudopilin GspI [Candidatus Sumerlaeota bacterium]|nr:type II secretion system minor pseudopilin GspI [Candidatus Sumerlaeota bacterium]
MRNEPQGTSTPDLGEGGGLCRSFRIPHSTFSAAQAPPAVRIRKRSRGFSLIEVLAALAIFSMSIVGLIEGLGMAMAQWHSAENKAKALMLAENVMEEINYNSQLTPGQDGAQYDPPDDRFTWASEIEETDTPGLYKITVSITWTAGGQDRDVTLTTLRAEHSQAQLQYAVTE